ncbi:MAG: GNAT family N-acetyltransferase [Phycisphaerae bacterium]|jgi:GNAT superfamily N-acetyltransferase
MSVRIRPATPHDVPLLCQLIRDLAVYEKLEHECRVTPEGLHDAIFGPRPSAKALVGELSGVPEGFALYFTNFSTFLAKPGIYLEDLFVRPHARGSGLGKALLSTLARIAVDQGCGRVEWSVLDWNEPAIGFYKRLGAVPMSEWTVFRLTGEALRDVATLAPR